MSHDKEVEVSPRRPGEGDSWSPNSWAPESLSLRNPWIIAGLAGASIIALVLIAEFLFGFPNVAATIIVKCVYCGFWIAMFLYDMRKRKWASALVSAAFVFAGYLW